MPWEGGWLLGVDMGKWGGELTYGAAGAEPVLVAKTLVEPSVIFMYREAVYAVTAGMEGGHGYLARFDCVRKRGKAWSTEALLTLPAPAKDVVIEGERVLVRLESNGWVDVTDWRDPHWLGCTRSEAP